MTKLKAQMLKVLVIITVLENYRQFWKYLNLIFGIH